MIRSARRPARRTKSLASNYFVLGLLAAFSLLPLVVLVFNSVKTTREIGSNPFGPPLSLQLSNFPQAWIQGHYAVTMRNSAIVVAEPCSAYA